MDVSLGPDERLIYEEVNPVDLQARIVELRRDLAHFIIVCCVFTAGSIIVFYLLTPVVFSIENMVSIDIIFIPIIWGIFFIFCSRIIIELNSRFYKAFTPDELKTYARILRITDQRVILKGRDQFYEKINEIPPDLVSKHVDTIIAARESLAAVEVEAQFFTFRINLCLKKFSRTQVPRKNLVSFDYDGKKFQSCLNKLEDFARSREPTISLTHLDHPIGWKCIIIALFIVMFLLTIILLR